MKKINLFIMLLVSIQSYSQIASYNFTSGSGNDISGNGNNGTLYGASSCGDTLCIGLNTNDYFQIPSSILNSRVEFSILFKIKFNELNISGIEPTNHLFSGDLTSSVGTLGISYQKSVNKWYLVSNGNVYTFDDNSIIPNNWYCVCFSRSSSGLISLWVNGIKNSTTYTNTSPLSMTNLLIGQETDCYGGCFAANQSSNAKFDEIKIYHNALTSDDLKSNCSTTSQSLTCNDIATYDFVGGSAGDISGNANNGTLYGASSCGDTLCIGLNTNDYLQIPSSVLNGRIEFSILFKIKFNELNISGIEPTNHLFSGDLTGSLGSFALSYQKDENKWHLINNGSVYTFDDNSIIPNHWYCVCFTRSSSGLISLWVDGIKNSSTYTNTSPLSMTNLLIGQETDCYGGCFAANQSSNAKFDFIRICAGEILEEEINNKCSSVFFNINEFNQNYTTLFPNPASSFLNIKIVETSKIELFDIIGNKIYEEMGNDIQMNLENYKDGYYVVRISRKKIVENYKLIISK